MIKVDIVVLSSFENNHRSAKNDLVYEERKQLQECRSNDDVISTPSEIFHPYHIILQYMIYCSVVTVSISWKWEGHKNCERLQPYHPKGEENSKLGQ